MATVFDTKFRALAVKLINRFGVTLGNGTIKRVTPGLMNQDTGKIGNTTSDQIIPMSPPIGYKQGDIDGETIRRDDFKIFVAGADWDAAFPAEELKPNEVLIINGITVRVLDPNPIYSGDQVALYAMQCRKGSGNA